MQPNDVDKTDRPSAPAIMKWLTATSGLLAILQGSATLMYRPLDETGLWGISYMGWASFGLTSGIVWLLVSYFAYWRR